MFVTLVHCHVKPEHLDAFIDAIQSNHEASTREPGNLRFDVIQSVEDPTRFVLYEWYVDEAAARRPQGDAALPRLAGGSSGLLRRAALRGALRRVCSRRRRPGDRAAGDPRVRARPAAADHVRRGAPPAPSRNRPLPTVSRVLLVTGARSLAASGRRAELLGGFAGAGLGSRGRGGGGPTSPRRTWSTGRSTRHRGTGIDVVVGVGGGERPRRGKGDRRPAPHRDERPIPPRGRRPRPPRPRAGPCRSSPCPRPQAPGARRAGTPSSASVARQGTSARSGTSDWSPADAVVDPDLLGGGPSEDRRERHGRRDAAARELRLAPRLRRSPTPLPWPALTPPGRALSPGTAIPKARARPPPDRGWPSPRSCPGSASRTPGSAPSTGSPRRSGRSCRSARRRCGATLTAVTAASIAALRAACARLASPAEIRRTRSPPRAPRQPARPSAEARGALVATLRRGTRELAIPGLRNLRPGRGGHPGDRRRRPGAARCRTNPVPLTDDELVDILRAAT